jgi:hypothetical protein
MDETDGRIRLIFFEDKRDTDIVSWTRLKRESRIFVLWTKTERIQILDKTTDRIQNFCFVVKKRESRYCFMDKTKERIQDISFLDTKMIIQIL